MARALAVRVGTRSALADQALCADLQNVSHDPSRRSAGVASTGPVARSSTVVQGAPECKILGVATHLPDRHVLAGPLLNGVRPVAVSSRTELVGTGVASTVHLVVVTVALTLNDAPTNGFVLGVVPRAGVRRGHGTTRRARQRDEQRDRRRRCCGGMPRAPRRRRSRRPARPAAPRPPRAPSCPR